MTPPPSPSPPADADPQPSSPATAGTDAAPFDGALQRLFAVALGLRTLAATTTDGGVITELRRLEILVDELIRDLRDVGHVRAEALSAAPPEA